MIRKNFIVSVGGAHSFGKSENTIDVENCSPKELEKNVIEMYLNGEISLKDTLAFRLLDLKITADDIGIDIPKINPKYFSKLWDNPNTRRNLYKDYKSAFHQMLIDGDASKNLSMMKNAIKLLDKMMGQKSFSAVYKNKLTKV